jgi:hypothetical protein
MTMSEHPESRTNEEPVTNVTNVTNVSGGVNVDAKKVKIRGDVVGRDKIKIMFKNLRIAVGPNSSVESEVRESIQLILTKYDNLVKCKQLHHDLQDIVIQFQTPYKNVKRKSESITTARRDLNMVKSKVDGLQLLITTDNFLRGNGNINTYNVHLVRTFENLMDSKTTHTMQSFITQGRQFDQICFDYLRLVDGLLRDLMIELSNLGKVLSEEVANHESSS